MDNWELINFSEIDKYAIQSYCAIFDEDENKNLGDITKIDENELTHYKMICGGSPCNSFSIAGKQDGCMWQCNKCGYYYNPLFTHYTKRNYCPKCGCLEHTSTKSAVLVDWLRIIRANKPDWIFYENVKNILNNRFKTVFDAFISELKEYGYNIYYDILNAKDFGVPQNRERLYLIGIKQILDNGLFCFPKTIPLTKKFKDILEDDVDEKYNHNTKAINYMNREVSGGRNHWDFEYYQDDELDIGRCLTANLFKGVPYNVLIEHKTEPNNKTIRIRKLTPRECLRLMGFQDEIIDKILLSGVSDTQLYKQAGNSIVVNVLYYILKNLKEVMPYLFDELKVGSFFSGIGAIEVALNRLFEGGSL